MKRTLTLVAAATLALIVTAKALAAGELTQKVGTAACVSYGGTGGVCQAGNGLDAAQGVVVSRDGKSVYVAAFGSDAVAIFDRDPATGALVQKAGRAGCVSDDGTGGACEDGKALKGATRLATSPDGTSVYVGSANSDAVAVFDRDPASGALVQKAGAAGCVSEDGTGGACQNGKALVDARSVAVAPDGDSVYVASQGSDAVAVFARDRATGALTQKAGAAGCVSETGTNGACRDGAALDEAYGVAASPDGRSVYAASAASDAVAILDRTMPATPTASSPGADTRRPTVSGFTVTPRRFRVARKATAIDAARRGAQFRFGLSEAASSRIVIDRALPGRRVGRRCKPATHRLRRHRPCTRFTRAGTLRRANRPAGLNRVPFSGRIAKRALAPGHYRATTTATDRAGNVSQPRRLRLRIVRR
jgi:DNA-binding beta-propeller fold protein YncE